MRLAARSTSTPLMSGILMSEISRSIGSRSSSVDRRAAVLGEQHVVAFAPQHDRQQLPHRPLVVDDEDARAAAARWSAAAAWVAVCVMSSPPRAPAGAPTRSVPVAAPRAHLDLAVVVGHDAVDDREAEAAALGEAAVERLEEAVELLRRDADALVLDGDARRRPIAGSKAPTRRSRPPSGIARRPLVARFQTICLICPSSASYHSSVGGTSTSIT